MIHTNSCLERQIATAQENARYTVQWPKHCETCFATGALVFVENAAPHGEGHWPMEVTEPCNDCSLEGQCPRCGEAMEWEADNPICANCGWEWNNADHKAPSIWSCEGMCALMEARA